MLAITWITLCVLFAFINRFIGSDEQKSKVGALIHPLVGTRATAYSLALLAMTALLLLLDINFLRSFIGVILLTAYIVWSRQQSPRGTYFLCTGGRTHFFENEKMHPLDGDHNEVTMFLAKKITGIDPFDAIIDSDSKSIKKYAWAYGALHISWPYFIMLLPLSLAFSPFSVALLLVTALFPVCFYLAGVDGLRKTEENAIAYGEYGVGVIYATVFIGNIIGALYF